MSLLRSSLRRGGAVRKSAAVELSLSDSTSRWTGMFPSLGWPSAPGRCRTSPDLSFCHRSVIAMTRCHPRVTWSATPRRSSRPDPAMTGTLRAAPPVPGGGWLSAMTDWSHLRDIYGSADGIPDLLTDAASVSDWGAPVWDELWSRLYHQGSVAPASYEALPTLATIAGTRDGVAVDPALFLAAAIVASNDGPLDRVEVRRLHASHIDRMRPVAEHKLALVRERSDILWALKVVAELDGSVWERGLEGRANDEIELDCTSCGDLLYLRLAEGRLVTTTGPDSIKAGESVQPADAARLGTAETRLVELCRAHDHAGLETELLQLFGRTRCPCCAAEFTVLEALAD